MKCKFETLPQSVSRLWGLWKQPEFVHTTAVGGGGAVLKWAGDTFENRNLSGLCSGDIPIFFFKYPWEIRIHT